MVKSVNLIFWVDVSGVPYEDTYVGVLATTTPQIRQAIKSLKKEAPLLLNKKARQLNREQLLRVLKTLNNEKIKMFTTCFRSKMWEEYKNEFGGLSEFKSKMIAYIYYKLLKQNELYTNFSYVVITCVESHLEINRVHFFCKRLAESDKITLNISHATGDSDDGIKLVDFVAKSLRSNRVNNLSHLSNLKCIKIDRDERLLRKLFD